MVWLRDLVKRAILCARAMIVMWAPSIAGAVKRPQQEKGGPSPKTSTRLALQPFQDAKKGERVLASHLRQYAHRIVNMCLQ